MDKTDDWVVGLKALYDEYVRVCSTKKMAISLQSAMAIAQLCVREQPESVLDFGSGFSSVTLAYMKSLGLISPHIESVDSSGEWLKKTESFLSTHDLQVDQLTPLETFSYEKGYDLILHDIGGMERRATLLPRMWSMLNDGGWIMFDDVHKPKYRKAVDGFLSAIDHALDEERSKGTLDQFSRYALFASKGA